MAEEQEQKSILITGANGFIGSRMCRKFIDKGYRVIAGVRKTSDLTLLDNLPVEYRYSDVSDPDSLPHVVLGVNIVIHNAGLVKAKDRETFFRVNEGGTRNLLEALEKHNPHLEKFVYISSLAVAGPSMDGTPVTENDPPHPITTYGESKMAGEKATLEYKDRFNVVSVRPPGVYGPGDREILTFFQTVNRRIKPHLGDINRKLQLVHVDDLCDGIYAAVKANTQSGSIYFVCEKTAYTFAELIGHIQQALGKKAVPLRVPGGLFRLIGGISEFIFKIANATPMLTREKADELLASWEIDTSRARLELGWESQIPFPEGARETVEWYRREGWL